MASLIISGSFATGLKSEIFSGPTDEQILDRIFQRSGTFDEFVDEVMEDGCEDALWRVMCQVEERRNCQRQQESAAICRQKRQQEAALV